MKPDVATKGEAPAPVLERRLPDFITAFERFCGTYNTTPQFAKAGGVWMIGTAPQRGIAMKSRGNALSPNLFMMLVGGPGTGKSQLVNAVKRVFIPATGMSLIPPSVTRAGLEDYMRDNLQANRRTPDGARVLSNECIGLAEEMQGILPDQDLGHLTLYNILYDLPNKHVAQTRTSGRLELMSPYMSMLAGAQPAFLAVTMPEQAWGMGFMSRTIMIFDTPGERKSMFELRDVDMKLLGDLIHDLKQIHNLHGWMSWDKQATTLYEEWWVKHGGKPIPSAKRLAMGYNSRRELHFAKLAMIMSLSRSNSLIVTVEDAARAIEYLLKAEDRMKHIFAEMSQTGAMVAIEDVLDMVRAKTAAGESCTEASIIEMLLQRFPATQVRATIEQLIGSGALKPTGGLNSPGLRKFQAGARVALL